MSFVNVYLFVCVHFSHLVLRVECEILAKFYGSSMVLNILGRHLTTVTQSYNDLETRASHVNLSMFIIIINNSSIQHV